MTVAHLHSPRSAATRRLSGRARSVAGVETALGRIWAELAREGITDRPAEGHMTTLARTRVLTLIVVATRPETAERAMDAVVKLAARHPSRTLVVALGDPTGPTEVDARVEAHCHLFGNSSEVCTEQVYLRLAGDSCHHPAALTAPLLLHDLPVALWWTDDPPIGSRPFDELVALADRLIVDSGLFRDDGRARLIGLAAAAKKGLEVHDIGWMRLELWRELLASLFDDPALRPFLGSVVQVRLTVTRPASLVRVSRAALYLGWLASRLGWRVERTLEPAGEGAFAALMTRRRRRIEVEVAAEDVAPDPRFRVPGGFLRVELESVSGRHRTHASVSRADDHLLARAEIDGRPCTQRTAILEKFEDSPYLAQALEAPGPDRALHAALPVAASLADGSS